MSGYFQHAIGKGATAEGIAYIELKSLVGSRRNFGVRCPLAWPCFRIKLVAIRRKAVHTRVTIYKSIVRQVGIDSNTTTASLKAICSGVNRMFGQSAPLVIDGKLNIDGEPPAAVVPLNLDELRTAPVV